MLGVQTAFGCQNLQGFPQPQIHFTQVMPFLDNPNTVTIRGSVQRPRHFSPIQYKIAEVDL